MSCDEKRNATRHTHMDVLYVSDGHQVLRGSILDISLTGIRFVTDKKLPERYIIDVNVNYRFLNFLLKAYIVRSKPNDERMFEHGAAFLEIPKDKQLLLEDYVKDITVYKNQS